MIERLLNLHKNSYTPISHFPVSAAIVMKDGNIINGVNVEDASTRSGACAERVAIMTAVTLGYKKEDFKELHVMVSSGNIGFPCFVCRQLILEFFDKDAMVTCYDTEGNTEIHTVGALCPYPFGSEDLK